MRNIILSWALLLRVLFLRLKPPHFDESINGWFVMQTWQRGYFSYDPSNFHGPLFFYFLQLCEAIMGTGIFALRFGTALLSVACIWVALAHRRFFGKPAIWAAAVLTFSPAMVFYGRYAIHETLFVLAQLIFSYGFWAYRERASSRAMGTMILAAAMAMATKETFFIFFGTWAIALVGVQLFARFEEKFRPDAAKAPIIWGNRRPLSNDEKWTCGIYAGLAVFALVCLYTGFFSEMAGVKKFFTAFSFWTKTGSAHTGHEKPFIYWGRLLLRYEWAGLAALALTPVFFIFPFSRKARFYALLSFGMWLAYSIIPYKTPWCIMGILWPMSFALGFFTTEFKTMTRRLRESGKLRVSRRYHVWRLAMTLTLLASLYKSVQLNFVDYANAKEPYVYVQSTEDINTVMTIINNRVREAPQDKAMTIGVWTEESWPFPWLLGDFPHVSYAKFTKTDALDFPDVIFIDDTNREKLESQLKEHYLRVPLNMRDAYQSGSAYFRKIQFQNVITPESAVMRGGGH